MTAARGLLGALLGNRQDPPPPARHVVRAQGSCAVADPFDASHGTPAPAIAPSPWRRVRRGPRVVLVDAAPAGAWDPRDPVVAVALARLEVATRLRDAAAAGRILDELARGSGGGYWLRGQMAAAGLRALAASAAAQPGDEGPRPPQPSPPPPAPPFVPRPMTRGPMATGPPAALPARHAVSSCVRWCAGGLYLPLPARQPDLAAPRRFVDPRPQ